MSADRLLLVTHVALKHSGGGFWIDDQTAQGLVRWCENFDSLAYAGIAVPAAEMAQLSSIAWTPIDSLPCASRIEVIAMPHAYKIGNLVATYRQSRALMAKQIRESRYLCYTLGALFGDWGGVAALESIRQRRDYAVWFDRVEHEVVRSDLPSLPLKRRIKQTLSLPAMQYYHRHLTRRSRLGLFQGKDCFDHYRRFSDRAFCMYDTHTQESDFIDPAALDAKIASVGDGTPLRLCYAGRAADMKGPLDWLEALAKLRDAGAPFTATWWGDGPLLETMRRHVDALSLTAQVELKGFVSDRAALLTAMKSAHVFLFCHKTPESPRCLIEALVCGTPIVGYGSAYARDLVAAHGGGRFVDVGDIQGLAELLLTLHHDRAALQEEIGRAAQAGLRFDEGTLYRDRANLIRENL